MRAISIAVALTLTSSALAQSAPAFQAGSASPSAVSSANTAPVMTANAELLMMVEQLQQEVQYLRGAVEEQAHHIKQLKQQGRDRYRDLDQRLLQLKPVSGSGNGGSGSSASVAARAPLAVAPTPKPVKPTGKSDPKAGGELKSAPSGDRKSVV